MKSASFACRSSDEDSATLSDAPSPAMPSKMSSRLSADVNNFFEDYQF